MKEIKAFVRRERVNQIVEELQHAEAPGITVTEVHPVGYGYEPNYFESNYRDVLSTYDYLAIVKLEVVCADVDLENLVQVVQKLSHTGNQGDGMIFVSEVIESIRIRDGARGERIL